MEIMPCEPSLLCFFPLVFTFGKFAHTNVYNPSHSFIMLMFWQVRVMRILLGFSEWVVKCLYAVLLVFPQLLVLVNDVYTWKGSGESS